MSVHMCFVVPQNSLEMLQTACGTHAAIYCTANLQRGAQI